MSTGPQNILLPDSPAKLRRRLERLEDRREERRRDLLETQKRLAALTAYLSISDQVTDALEILGQRLFKDLLSVVEQKLTIALEEILEQPIRLRAEADFKRGAATVDFWVERDGHREDHYRGQGGSVANILSVGLRLFALTTLDPKQHRRFLVLDEQDCWLRPDLVPRLVKIIQEAGRGLGFQVILISHHDPALFERFADKIYRFVPQPGGRVEVREVAMRAPDEDPSS